MQCEEIQSDLLFSLRNGALVREKFLDLNLPLVEY
jgi:hypothetical protein